MKLLLDSHIFLAILDAGSVELTDAAWAAITTAEPHVYVSAASLWEIAIKVRSGRLDFDLALEDLPMACLGLGMKLLTIKPRHAVCALDIEPPTNDPFDRLLLAQAQVEDMRPMTVDRSLVGHPLAWTAP